MFVNEVSRVIRNRAYISKWTYSTLACKNAQQFTVNSLAMTEALMASTSFDKLGMERPEIGPFELHECFCQEIQSPRDIVIRLTFMFYIIVLGYPFRIYTPHKTIPLVTLEDEELAKKITGVIKKKYDADPSFLFTKKFDRLFAPELMLTRFVQEPDSLLFGAPSVEAALKQRVKNNPNDESAKDVLAAYQLYDQAIAAAVQFFKINVIAFFVDISDGKSPKDALEKLMVMIACLGSMNILKLSV